MNKKGFTLVELLGVIVILGIIALISIPPILNQMASSEQSIDEATLRVVYSAGSLYLDERQKLQQDLPCCSFYAKIARHFLQNLKNRN